MVTTTRMYKLTAYPKDVVLRDGSVVTLRPMTAEDGQALFQFFQSVPSDDRYYLKEDVTDPAVVHRWARELDYDRTLPLLAWHEGKVIADATLHRTRALARRHVGQVRITMDPAYRMRGIGTLLLKEIGAIADATGVERLMLEAVADREAAAIQTAELAGFVQAGVLPGHVIDSEGHPRDIVLLEMPLGKWLEWWNRG